MIMITLYIIPAKQTEPQPEQETAASHEETIVMVLNKEKSILNIFYNLHNSIIYCLSII